MAIPSSRPKGLAMALLGVLVLSPDALLVRLVATDHATIIFWRGVLTAVGLCFFLLARDGRAAPLAFRAVLAWRGALLSTLFATSTALFVFSITHTAVANTLVILAASPLFAALLSRFFLGEAARGETWAAILVVLGGLSVILAAGLAGEGFAGDVAAVGNAAFTATSLVVLRHPQTGDPVPAVVVGSLAAALVVGPAGAPLTVGAADMAALGLLGLVVIPVSFTLLFAAPRYIPAPEVGLVMLLEAALGPALVWLVLGERPSREVLPAGLVIVATLALHSAIALVRDARTLPAEV
ncbi:MAG: DMT family transporter [Proteobacteria bacterium]|nr:DMT family transporter [Pseudomonadota bacterium]